MYVQNHSTEKMSVCSVRVPGKTDGNQFWLRSHVALSTALGLTECALQLASASLAAGRGNLASDPNCTGHGCSGSRLECSGKEADLQKKHHRKAGCGPVKAEMLWEQRLLRLLGNVSYSQALPIPPQRQQYISLSTAQKHIFEIKIHTWKDCKALKPCLAIACK